MTREQIMQLNTDYLNGCESEHKMNELFSYALEQEPTVQEKQAESEKYQKAFDDGYDNGYAQARFDYEQEPFDNATNKIEYYEKQIDKLETALAENIEVLDKYEEEQKERDKGCVYCTTDRDGYITGFDKRGKYYISKNALGEPIFIIRGRELKQIPINFCPKCGRYLNAPYQKGGE